MEQARRPFTVLLLAVSSLTVMAGATIAPSLPAMHQQFAALANVDILVRLALTLPALFIVLTAPIAGWLVDRWGRKRLLVWSVFLYAVAGPSGLVLGSLYGILAGRALLGIAVAGVMISVTALIADHFEGERRAAVMGAQSAVMALGGVAFLTAGGFLAETGWRWPFALYALAVLFVPGVLASIREPQRSSDRFEMRTLPLPWRALAGVFLAVFAAMLAFYLIPVQVPFLLERIASGSPSRAGLAIAGSTLVAALIASRYARIKARLSFPQVVALGFVLLGGGYVLVGAAHGFPLALAGLGVAGVGLGLLMPTGSLWVVSLVSDGQRGRALGGLTAATFLGQFLSPLAFEPLADLWGLGGGFLAAGVGLVATAMVIALLDASRRRSIDRPDARLAGAVRAAAASDRSGVRSTVDDAV
jgi:MFS family permease